MPKQIRLPASIDRLLRCSGDHNPGYICVAALDAIVRALYAPNDRDRANCRLYVDTYPFDIARHKLRDLYDRPGNPCPLPLGEGWSEGPPAHTEASHEEREPPEDDEPL